MSQSNQTRGMLIYLDYNWHSHTYFILDLLTLQYYAKNGFGVMSGNVYYTTDNKIDLSKNADKINSPFIVVDITGKSCNENTIEIIDVCEQIWKFDLKPVPNCKKVSFDYVVFWEDMYFPYYAMVEKNKKVWTPYSYDNWTDEVIRITIYDNGDALITFLEGSGGYCHVIMWLPLSDVGENDFLDELIKKDYCEKCFSKLFPDLCKDTRKALLCKPYGWAYGENFKTCEYYDPCLCEDVSCMVFVGKIMYGIGMIKRMIGKREQKLFPIFQFYEGKEVVSPPKFYVKDFWPFLKKSS